MEQSITVGQHRLSIDEQALSLNGQSVQIREVSSAGIVLMDRSGQKYQISGNDFYRLIAGGVDPDPKIVGELMAKDMMHKQEIKRDTEPVPEIKTRRTRQYPVKSEKLIKG